LSCQIEAVQCRVSGPGEGIAHRQAAKVAGHVLDTPRAIPADRRYRVDEPRHVENPFSARKSVVEGVLEIGADHLGKPIVELHAEDDFRRQGAWH
jgi:hypothetical protein